MTPSETLASFDPECFGDSPRLWFRLNGKRFIYSRPAKGFDGFYRLTAGSVDIYSPDGRKVAAYTANRVLARATKVEGRYMYSYGDPDIIGAFPRHLVKDQKCDELWRAWKAGILAPRAVEEDN